MLEMSVRGMLSKSREFAWHDCLKVSVDATKHYEQKASWEGKGLIQLTLLH